MHAYLECGANGVAQVISFCRPILRSGLLLDDAPADADTDIQVHAQF